MDMKKLKKPIIRGILGILIGGILGFAYYKFIGCSSGTCPITSNPISSIIYGAVMGSLLSISKSKKENT
jgi:hypothetical protein